MDFTLHQLRCFLAVARELHFTRAAADLRVSPSTLSEQISGMERLFGRKLFERSSRAVTLTDHGVELLPLAQQVVSAAAEVAEWASDGVEASLTIGVTTSSPGIRAILTAAREQLSAFGWQVRPVGFTGGIPAVREGRVDCAFVFAFAEVETPADVSTYELWQESLMVILPETHWLASRDRISPKDLWGETLIAPVKGDRDTEFDEWYGQIDPSLVTECEVSRQVSSFDETMEVVASGMGINIAGESACELYARPGVVFVPLESDRKVASMLVVRKEEPSPLLARFIQLARGTARFDPQAEPGSSPAS